MTYYLQPTNETLPDSTLFVIRLLAQIGMRRFSESSNVTLDEYERLRGPMDKNMLTLMTTIGGTASGLPHETVIRFLDYIKDNL